jgi:hypothetical protein
MKNTQSPVNVGKAPQPVANTDYSHIYDEIKTQEDMKAKDQRELPYDLNSFPQILGNMITQVDDMILVINRAQTTDNLKDKIVTAQLEKLAKLKEDIIDLNFSIYDLKL